MFNIGDIVYYADAGQRRNDVRCPICFGKMRVKLVLGNDDEVILPCDYCGEEHDGPTGTVGEYEYIAEAKPFLITGIEIIQTKDGETRVYRSSGEDAYRSLSEEKCFATKEEALLAAVNVKEEYEREQQTRTEYIKKNTRKSFSWNAGYHMRQVKEAKKNIEYHEKMAHLCEERDIKKEEGDEHI